MAVKYLYLRLNTPRTSDSVVALHHSGGVKIFVFQSPVMEALPAVQGIYTL